MRVEPFDVPRRETVHRSPQRGFPVGLASGQPHADPTVWRVVARAKGLRAKSRTLAAAETFNDSTRGLMGILHCQWAAASMSALQPLVSLLKTRASRSGHDATSSKPPWAWAEVATIRVPLARQNRTKLTVVAVTMGSLKIVPALARTIPLR